MCPISCSPFGNNFASSKATNSRIFKGKAMTVKGATASNYINWLISKTLKELEWDI